MVVADGQVDPCFPKRGRLPGGRDILHGNVDIRKRTRTIGDGVGDDVPDHRRGCEAHDAMARGPAHGAMRFLAKLVSSAQNAHRVTVEGLASECRVSTARRAAQQARSNLLPRDRGSGARAPAA